MPEVTQFHASGSGGQSPVFPAAEDGGQAGHGQGDGAGRTDPAGLPARGTPPMPIASRMVRAATGLRAPGSPRSRTASSPTVAPVTRRTASWPARATMVPILTLAIPSTGAAAMPIPSAGSMWRAPGATNAIVPAGSQSAVIPVRRRPAVTWRCASGRVSIARPRVIAQTIARPRSAPAVLAIRLVPTAWMQRTSSTRAAGAAASRSGSHQGRAAAAVCRPRVRWSSTGAPPSRSCAAVSSPRAGCTRRRPAGRWSATGRR